MEWFIKVELDTKGLADLLYLSWSPAISLKSIDLAAKLNEIAMKFTDHNYAQKEISFCLFISIPIVFPLAPPSGQT